jgi:MoxR-like ATPase
MGNPNPRIEEIVNAARRIVLGKEREFRLALCCALAGRHLLIEDLPGMGKTTLVKTLARLLGFEMRRIQFTSDLMPSDILGVTIFEPQRQEFVFHPGPIFSQIVLGDELNRTSPKTQSACLQAMEEGEVTIDGVTHPLPNPFLFIATQNPIQAPGTFPLPDSQLDRFLMRLELGYPSEESEKELLQSGSRLEQVEALEPILSPADFISMQAEVEKTEATEAVVQYVLALLKRSRRKARGLSPRAGLELLRAARAWAFMAGRRGVLPEDVQAVAPHVMSHRLDYQVEGRTGLQIARELLAKTPVG